MRFFFVSRLRSRGAVVVAGVAAAIVITVVPPANGSTVLPNLYATVDLVPGNPGVDCMVAASCDAGTATTCSGYTELKSTGYFACAWTASNDPTQPSSCVSAATASGTSLSTCVKTDGGTSCNAAGPADAASCNGRIDQATKAQCLFNVASNKCIAVWQRCICPRMPPRIPATAVKVGTDPCGVRPVNQCGQFDPTKTASAVTLGPDGAVCSLSGTTCKLAGRWACDVRDYVATCPTVAGTDCASARKWTWLQDAQRAVMCGAAAGPCVGGVAGSTQRPCDYRYGF